MKSNKLGFAIKDILLSFYEAGPSLITVMVLPKKQTCGNMHILFLVFLIILLLFFSIIYYFGL